MAKHTISTPASGAGILNFGNIGGGGLQIDPKTVIFIAIGIIVIISLARLIVG
jgi:preprotein translocase subunit Sec61beta